MGPPWAPRKPQHLRYLSWPSSEVRARRRRRQRQRRQPRRPRRRRRRRRRHAAALSGRDDDGSGASGSGASSSGAGGRLRLWGRRRGLPGDASAVGVRRRRNRCRDTLNLHESTDRAPPPKLALPIPPPKRGLENASASDHSPGRLGNMGGGGAVRQGRREAPQAQRALIAP